MRENTARAPLGASGPHCVSEETGVIPSSVSIVCCSILLLLCLLSSFVLNRNGGRYLEAKKESGRQVVTRTSGSLSVAVLFAGLKERLQLLCGWERESVAVFSSRTEFLKYGKVRNGRDVI